MDILFLLRSSASTQFPHLSATYMVVADCGTAEGGLQTWTGLCLSSSSNSVMGLSLSLSALAFALPSVLSRTILMVGLPPVWGGCWPPGGLFTVLVRPGITLTGDVLFLGMARDRTGLFAFR